MATILLIEDDENISLNVTEILSLAKHHVLTANNGKDGIELAREHRPDVIVSDVLMPGIDGFGVLHILNQDPETRDIQFIYRSNLKLQEPSNLILLYFQTGSKLWSLEVLRLQIRYCMTGIRYITDPRQF